jgi:hypothetical protein
MLDSFHPEQETLLEIIIDAHYLGVCGLVDRCVKVLAKEFDGTYNQICYKM